MASELNLNEAERIEAFREINEKSDRTMAYALFAYFAFGIFLSFFYDTYVIAIGVGGLSLAAYFLTKFLLPNYKLYQYVVSAVFAIFSAQFIYQMHGLFEMHFSFFVGSALLITFRNWKLIIPLLLLTVVQHGSFAWLQYSGMKEIYFTQLDYMDLQAFLFHVALAGIIMGICAYWSYDLGRTTLIAASKSLIMERQVVNVANNIGFANEISNGNLNVEYKLVDDKDELGKSLLQMRDNLRLSSEREQEEKFTTIGITKVGDIVRQYGNDTTLLADEFIKGIVKYAHLNQGGLFLLEGEGDDAYLNLAACYAYDRKKFINKRLEIGEGIVGQCFLEREPVYMTVVPANYIKITSGLGEATPRCIYVVPVQTQDEIVGVIELASFTEMKEFEKQFINKAAANIASAIVSSRTTQRIKALLEDSQQQTEELKSQEEEVRQNMEELQATQEEMLRKQVENESRIKAINESGIASIEFNLKGEIQEANDAFLDLMGYTLDEIQNRHHRLFVRPEYANSAEYIKFWEDLSNGVPRPGEYERVTKTGKKVFIKGSYSIIRDQFGKPMRILKLATDITPFTLQQIELQAKMKELAQAEIEVKASRQSSKSILMESMNRLRNNQ
jgi:methyl-accepting chemotaxis protein